MKAHPLSHKSPIHINGTKPHVPWPNKLLSYNYTPCWEGALLKLEEDQLVLKSQLYSVNFSLSTQQAQIE